MPNDVPQNVLEEFIKDDLELGVALDALDLEPARFPFSEEGAEDIIAEFLDEIDTRLDDTDVEGYPISFSEAFDFVCDEFTSQFPGQLFLNEQGALLDPNSRDQYRDHFTSQSMSDLRAEVAIFLEWGLLSEFSQELHLSHRVKRKIETHKFVLSVSSNYFPDQRYVMIEVDLIQAKLPGSREKELFEKVVIVVNSKEPRNYQGIFYITNNSFDSNVPIPFTAGINMADFRDKSIRLCRPVTKKEKFGELTGRRSPDNRANHRHYATIALARAKKVLSLANETDSSSTYE